MRFSRDRHGGEEKPKFLFPCPPRLRVRSWIRFGSDRSELFGSKRASPRLVFAQRGHVSESPLIRFGRRAILFSFLIAAPLRAAAENVAPIASTQTGKVRGYVDQGISAFKGIPYGTDTATTRF